MSEAPAGIAVSFAGVSKRYGQVTAVDDVSLDIRAGEFLTLLGPSGSGKTTLLMMLAGFQDVSAGDILVGGRSIAAMAPEKRNFGMVFQGYALFPHMTVRRNISYPLDIRKRPATEIASRVAEMLDLVQLAPLAERYAQQLSGGQQQRVALARALSFSPKLLLLDEPLGALDRKLRADVQEQLKDIHRRIGTTFIYVTHDQEEALTMSDRIAIMNHGRIVQVGTPDDLYERPQTAFAASFLGKSNFIERNGKTYALRPERIGIAPRGKGSGPNRLEGTVRRITYMGAALRLVVSSPGATDIEVHMAAWRMPSRIVEGQAVDLCWIDEAAVPVETGNTNEAGARPAMKPPANGMT